MISPSVRPSVRPSVPSIRPNYSIRLPKPIICYIFEMSSQNRIVHSCVVPFQPHQSHRSRHPCQPPQPQPCQPGWQKLYESTKGLRQKGYYIWILVKISRLKYFVAILRFVAMMALNLKIGLVNNWMF